MIGEAVGCMWSDVCFDEPALEKRRSRLIVHVREACCNAVAAVKVGRLDGGLLEFVEGSLGHRVVVLLACPPELAISIILMVLLLILD